MTNYEKLLGTSWSDAKWIPILNETNILNYFAEKDNPFYERSCNNEQLRMRGLPLNQMADLERMQGTEYVLLHVQAPILYVIRKQRRTSPTQTFTIADFYIIAGTVYQAPDLNSIISTKLLSSIFELQSAFDDCLGFARYHPMLEYYWNFNKLPTSQGNNSGTSEEDKKPGTKEDILAKKVAQIQMPDRRNHIVNVDILMAELFQKFKPPPNDNKENGENGENGPSSEAGENSQDMKNEQSSQATSENDKTSGNKKPRLF